MKQYRSVNSEMETGDHSKNKVKTEIYRNWIFNKKCACVVLFILSLNCFSQTNRTFHVKGENFEMVIVEGGNFTMGCTEQGYYCNDDNIPSHRVTVSNFYIGKYLVTQKLWSVVMGTSLRQQRTDPNWAICGEGDNNPMYYVSYDDCKEFCNRLNTLLANQLPAGYKFRLPTEAEWEYAARGGKKSKNYKFSGSNNIYDVAWFDENSGPPPERKTVGSKLPNELGIYDMSGNLAEWCSDWYDKNYYRNTPSTNPKGPSYGSERVTRGGSVQTKMAECLVFERSFYVDGGRRNIDTGFRIVCSAN